jgi:hypothetical protein
VSIKDVINSKFLKLDLYVLQLARCDRNISKLTLDLKPPEHGGPVLETHDGHPPVFLLILK